MKFCFLLERGSPPRLNPVFAEVFARLQATGNETRLLFPEEELLSLDSFPLDADLYLLKSDSELSLSFARGLARRGGRVLNRVEGCLLAKDKVIAAAILARAGVPAPRSFAASDPALLVPQAARLPLILKPNRGYHGAGITVVEGGPIPPKASYPDMVFAQEYLAKARKDLKVFVIGEEVFGVRKAFAKESFLDAGAPTVLPPGVEGLARICGEAFGLELFGLDIAEDGDGFHVIDVNYFPGYRGVPDAAQRIAAYLSRAIRVDR